MSQLDELLLGVWREAGRHPTLPPQHPTSRHSWRADPLQQVLVRRSSRSVRVSKRLALVLKKTYLGRLASAANVIPRTLQRLMAWCHRGEVALWGRDASHARDMEVAVPAGVDDESFDWPTGQRAWNMWAHHAAGNSPHNTLQRSISRCSRLSWSRWRQR